MVSYLVESSMVISILLCINSNQLVYQCVLWYYRKLLLDFDYNYSHREYHYIVGIGNINTSLYINKSINTITQI